MFKSRKQCANPGGGCRGFDPPEKNLKNIEFLNITGDDPLNNHKTIKPAFNVGPSKALQRNTTKMAFRRRADDGPLLVVFGSPYLKNI